MELSDIQHAIIPAVKTIRLKTPFALFLLYEGDIYRIVAQDGEYCTFQELTVAERVEFYRNYTRSKE